MAFEYLEYDLWALANSSQVKLTGTHIKTYMKQMLDAIAYMHTNKVRTFRDPLKIACVHQAATMVPRKPSMVLKKGIIRDKHGH